ncbi:MAG: hypothetical protein ACRCXE_03720, partial [Metamycoplasmataceae bacterium]
MTKWWLGLTALPILATVPLVSCSTDDEDVIIHTSLEGAKKFIQDDLRTIGRELVVNELEAILSRNVPKEEEKGEILRYDWDGVTEGDMSWEMDWPYTLVESKKGYDVLAFEVPGYTASSAY